MVVKNPCKLRKNAVAINHKAIKCDLFETWVHIKCNKINKQTYSLLEKSKANWFCLECTKLNFPFGNLEDEDFHHTITGKEIKFIARTQSINNKQSKLIEKMNFAMDHPNQTEEFHYFDTLEFNDLIQNTKNSISFLHLNISSLPFDHQELQALLTEFQLSFDCIGITESRLQTGTQPITNISIYAYIIEQTPTESSKGGAFLYINNKINYKMRNDLQIYKSKELESIFIEIIESKGQNIIIGCIYKHPNMSINDFQDNYLTNLLNILSRENKSTILMGDYNINLLQYDTQKDVSDFLDNMYTHSFIPYITSPTRITKTSSTLIDNIFCNEVNEGAKSGNLTISLSDHLAQFLILPSKNSKNNKNIDVYQRNMKNLNEEALKSDIKNIHWDNVLNTNSMDINQSFSNFYTIINNILDIHAPFKKLSKREIKLKSKPWITKGILKSIKIKNKIHKKFLKAKDPIRKENLLNTFKIYRNYINKLIRCSQSSYYQIFFPRT